MKHALVTGTNRGIGLAICKQLEKKGYEIFACCRNPSKALTSLPVHVIENIDVIKADAAIHIKEALEGKKLDLLIHNAGILIDDCLEDIKAENLIEQFNTNAVAPFILTRDLLPSIEKEGKIVMISSSAGSIELKKSGGKYGYRASKCALNMLSRSLSFDLQDKNMAVYMIHPGYVQTDMTDHEGHIDVTTSAKGIVTQIEKFSLKDNGTFIDYSGKKMPW